MHIVFYSTNNVFRAEELLKESGVKCDIVPTPVVDRAYCGVCIEIEDGANLTSIAELEYVVVEE